jgi:nucleotide-binding universal stress UspA family protein
MKTGTSHTLSISHLKPNPRVVHLLPSELAHRYHALPVATDGEHITVAMAHPDDLAARQAVFDSLGPETYVVQADTQELELMLNELWPIVTNSGQHFMSWKSHNANSVDLESYAQAFAQLMDAQLTSIDHAEVNKNPLEFLLSKIQHQHPDLLIFHSPLPILPLWLMPHWLENQLIKQTPVSLLVTRNPHWPLQNILLVLRDSKFDAAAITWTVQIASKSGAAVTILPLVVPAPPVYAGINFKQRSLINLLGSTCPLGETLRLVSQNLAERDIRGTLRLRDGNIVEQIRQEVEEHDYDFAVIAADAQHSIVRWMMGELVNPLLNIAKIPTLLAKSC